jgi:prepilin-type N-terminal cleavage/methylation domain-containing protein
MLHRYRQLLLLAGHTKKKDGSDQGFTLVEAMVSLIIFGVVLAGVLPVFVTFTLGTIQNNAETGAIAISQQILDELRQTRVTTLPNASDPPAAKTQTRTIQYEQTSNTYQATINYCQRSEFCNEDSRHISVAVRLASSPETLYEVETIYTEFQ